MIEFYIKFFIYSKPNSKYRNWFVSNIMRIHNRNDKFKTKQQLEDVKHIEKELKNIKIISIVDKNRIKELLGKVV